MGRLLSPFAEFDPQKAQANRQAFEAKRAQEAKEKAEKESAALASRAISAPFQRMVRQTEHSDTLLYRGIIGERQMGDLAAQKRHIETQELLETMASGEPTHTKRLGDDEGAGFSFTSREIYEDAMGREIVAYRKPLEGEARFDAEGYQLSFDGQSGAWVRKMEGQPDASERSVVARAFKEWFSEEYQEEYCRGLQSKYGIPENEYDAFKQTIGEETGCPRLGIEVGGTTVREKVAYDMSTFLGFDVVPPTVLRMDKEAFIDAKGNQKERLIGLASVQQGVVSENGVPGRNLYADEYQTLMFTPPETWGERMDLAPADAERFKDSMAEMAAFHWLVGALDAHTENVLMTHDGRLHSIDNGLIFSKKRDVDVQMTKGPEITAAVHKFRSVPMDILQAQKGLALSEQAKAKLADLSVRIQAGQPEALWLEKNFQTMFENPHVANKEMNDFLERLKYLAAHGRPPDADLAEGKNFNITYQTMVMGIHKERPEEPMDFDVDIAAE